MAARVQNDRVKSVPALLGAALALTLALTGCSSSDDSSSGASGGATASASPYLPVPTGVELTTPGSELSVGDHAVVAYRPRQDQVAALDIQVTKLERTTVKSFSAWQLSNAQKRSTPYYVRATVKNVGDTDLGGRPVPLYVVNGDNVLLESTPFASSFEACPSTPFPKKFGPGATAQVCLVYLALDHGRLTAVSFRPDEKFDPITWTGDVTRYHAAKAKAKRSQKAG